MNAKSFEPPEVKILFNGRRLEPELFICTAGVDHLRYLFGEGVSGPVARGG